MSLLAKTKSNTVKRLLVDVVGKWDEGYYSYPGRSDLLSLFDKRFIVSNVIVIYYRNIIIKM